MLKSTLFGTPHIYINGTSISEKLVGKELALFAFLAVNREPCSRTKIIDILWGDAPEQKARDSLRSLLYTMRQTLGDYLIVTRQIVCLNRQLPYWLDVEIFTSLPERLEHQETLLWSEVLRLHGQEFMDGFQITNAPSFDDWLSAQREQLRNRAITGWRQIVDRQWGEQQLAEAILSNQQLLLLAPWDEEAHRKQMQILATSGQRSAALAHYEICRQQLHDELDILPSAETTNLYRQIKAQIHTIPKPSSPPAAPPAKQPSTTSSSVTILMGGIALPRRLWGRQQELQLLLQWLSNEQCRLVTIHGIVGVGKTALVAGLVQLLALPTTMNPSAFNTIIVTTCRSVSTPTHLIHDWLQQLSSQPSTTLPLTLDRQLDRLIQLMQQQRVLFVLDDVDHWFTHSDAAKRATYLTLLQLLVEREHRCTLLLTTNQTLPISLATAEPDHCRHLPLGGLPPNDSRQLLMSYGLQGSSADIELLQQHYAGHPLLLHLVAHEIQLLFAQQIAAFLQEDMPFTQAMITLLDQQLALLSPLEEELLTHLALNGGADTHEQLRHTLVTTPSKRDYMAALSNLVRYTLVELRHHSVVPNQLFAHYLRGRRMEGDALLTSYQRVKLV